MGLWTSNQPLRERGGRTHSCERKGLRTGQWAKGFLRGCTLAAVWDHEKTYMSVR